MIAYRRDIDGLRAFAVLSVLFYHAGIGGITGGYTGVDIFFVISGFLITSILYRDIRDKKFSIVAFYERRIRRIFPALFAVLTVTVIVGWFILLPNDFKNFGKSLTGAVAFYSNIVLKKGGYFDTSAWDKPLLHTWSLAVEEQFYIFFPLILYAVWRFSKKRYNLVTFVIFAVSLAWSIYAVQTGRATSAFFLLPARAWELLTGSLLALGFVPAIKNKSVGHILSAAGFGLMLAGIVTLNDDSAFPGLNALYPCMGAALFLIAGERAVMNKFMSLSPFVFIGKISYSLYLWHWPMLVFAKYYTMGELSQAQAYGVVAASVVVSAASWKFIEQPIREKKVFAERRKLFIAAAIAMIVFAGAGIAIKKTDGVPGRFDNSINSVLSVAEDAEPRRVICHNLGDFPNEESMNKCTFGDNTQKEFSAVLMGDSHAGSIPSMLGEVLKNKSVKMLELTSTSCPPLVGVYVYLGGTAGRQEEFTLKCNDFNSKALQYISNNPYIKTVILHSRWAYYTETTNINAADINNRIYLVDAENQERSKENSLRVFENGLRVTLEKLRSAGKKVIIIASVPEMTFNPAICSAKSILFSKKYKCIPISFSDYTARQKTVLEIFSQYPEIPVFYPHETLCSGELCMTEKDGTIIYADDDHLSVEGTMILMPKFEEFWDRNFSR